MGPPAVLDHKNTALLWALWNNIDPTDLLIAATEERADTISVESYEVPYKHTPSNAFPSRRSHYANVLRVKAQQNMERARYCSTAPLIGVQTVDEDMMVQATSTPLREPQSKVNLYKSDTFLTDLPEFYTFEAEPIDKKTKICMPAFLPTIQAKTQTKLLEMSKSSAVRKYLERNHLTDNIAPAKPQTADTFSTNNTLTSMSVIRKSVLPREIQRTVTTTQKPKRRKTTKHKTKYKQTGNKKKKVGRLYFGNNRELSTTTKNGITTSNKVYQSFVTPQEDLITHFSRISMRQVQSTLNSNRLALPSI